MQSTLMQLNADLFAGLAENTRLTERPAPEQAGLAACRIRLVRANEARIRFLEDEAYPRLLAALPEAESAPVRRLRAEADRLRTIADHYLADWPNEAMLADWPGYCRASRAMRAATRRQVAAEQRLIMPLLGRFAAAAERAAA